METEPLSKRQKTNEMNAIVNPNSNSGTLGIRSVITAAAIDRALSPLAFLFTHEFFWKTLFDFSAKKITYIENHTGIKKTCYAADYAEKELYDLLYDLRLVCKAFREASHIFLPFFFSVFNVSIPPPAEPMDIPTEGELSEKEEEFSEGEEDSFVDILTYAETKPLPLGLPPLVWLKLSVCSEEELQTLLGKIAEQRSKQPNSRIVVQEIMVRPNMQPNSSSFTWEMTRLFPSTLEKFTLSRGVPKDVGPEQTVKLKHCTCLKSIEVGVCKGELELPQNVEEFDGMDIDGFKLDLSKFNFKTVFVGNILNGGNCILPTSIIKFCGQRVGPDVTLDFRLYPNLRDLAFDEELEGKCFLSPQLENFHVGSINSSSFNLEDKDSIKTLYIGETKENLSYRLPPNISELELGWDGDEKSVLDLSSYTHLEKLTLRGCISGTLLLPPNLKYFSCELIHKGNVNFIECPNLLSVNLQGLVGDYTFPASLEEFKATQVVSGECDFSQCVKKLEFKTKVIEGKFKFPDGLTSFVCKRIGVGTDINLTNCKQLTELKAKEMEIEEYKFLGSIILSSKHHKGLEQSLPAEIQHYIYWDEKTGSSYVSSE